MTNKIFTIVFALLTITAFAQKKQKVDLDWKIGKGEKLSYMTVMSEIDTSSVAMNFDGLIKSFSDSTREGISAAKDFFKKLNNAFKDIDLVTTLTNKGQGVIDIVTVANQNKDKQLKADTSDRKQKEIIKMMQAMNKGIVLRGSVYETGGIHSFWTESNQKNLIAIFFELPTKPVQVGDSWHLDLNLISNDQNFECDSSYKLNKVTLVDLKKVGGENIAVLKYDIVEYVKGNFTIPSRGGNSGSQTETMMKFTHQAVAEFSVDKGRWISYDGIMTLVASGVMTANQKKKFTLIKV
jgi:hypothetical protein